LEGAGEGLPKAGGRARREIRTLSPPSLPGSWWLS